MVLAAVAAILLGLLLLGISYFLTPDQSNQKPLPMPVPSTLNQIFMALLWIGFAALIAFTIVVLALLINRIRRKFALSENETITTS